MASSYQGDGDEVGQGQGEGQANTLPTTAIHTTTTQTATLTNSLLDTPFHHKTTSSSSPSSSASSSTPQPPAKPNTKPKPPPSKSRPAKSHPCPWPNCGRYFTCPHNVRQHIREKHTFERPSVCPICRAQGADGSFTRPFGLNRHMEQVHGVTKADRRKKARWQNRAGGGDTAAATTREGGRNPGSEAYGVEVGELAGKMTDVVGGGGDFGRTAALLAEANAQMGSSNEDDAEIPDDSFRPGTDASDSVSSEEASTTVAASTSGGFSCSACGSIFAQPHAIYEHMHTAHANPHSRLCSCNACKTLFFPREEDAVEHASQLQGGGFLVLGDGVLAAAAAAGVANSAAMSPLSHHFDNAGMDPAALGFAEGVIDPGLLLLLLPSYSSSHAADAEGGGGALLPDLGRM